MTRLLARAVLEDGCILPRASVLTPRERIVAADREIFATRGNSPCANLVKFFVTCLRSLPPPPIHNPPCTAPCPTTSPCLKTTQPPDPLSCTTYP
ncbi:hypothetical protein BT67DRAFT_116902 [Trichocladium antarcticum]|uniref:Uncharacterized protein n=1 Tax=Trichocladium antarcticum TaxID=1450529 RepID=A0AAN6UR42_9PEZI|nr:hypothetical protein BT67DRAFT_116902 [Trichocladium antarcticum]